MPSRITRERSARRYRAALAMTYPAKSIPLKDGRTAVLRSPAPDDAAEMLTFIRTCSAETEFLVRLPDECPDSVEAERTWIARVVDSPDNLLILALVEGEIVGSAQVSFNRRRKVAHRATIGITILRKCWNLGLGTALIGELITAARQQGVTQLELDFIEGNARARALYEKMGFRIAAVKPNAIRQPDGRLVNEYFMILPLA